MKKIQPRKNTKKIAQGAVALAVLGFSLACLAADPKAGTIEAFSASLKSEVTSFFGPSGVIAYALYIAEIIMGVAAYIKTKNLMVLLGLPIIILFTNAAFSFISGGGG